jgi:hypothetical protein
MGTPIRATMVGETGISHPSSGQAIKKQKKKGTFKQQFDSPYNVHLSYLPATDSLLVYQQLYSYQSSLNLVPSIYIVVVS